MPVNPAVLFPAVGKASMPGHFVPEKGPYDVIFSDNYARLPCPPIKVSSPTSCILKTHALPFLARLIFSATIIVSKATYDLSVLMFLFQILCFGKLS